MSALPIPRIANFKKFWPFYVGEHSKAATRWLHFAGTLGGTIVLFILIIMGYPRYIPLILLYSYGLAWIGHFFVEKNRPATFKYPLWSFLADYKMCAFMLAGKMEAELQKTVTGRKSLY